MITKDNAKCLLNMDCLYE